MTTRTVTSIRASAGNSIYVFFAAFPVACFTLTLITDITYWRTANLMWQNFSSWLLLFGLVGGGLAALAWIVAALTGRGRDGWIVAIVNLAVLVAAFLNSFVHAGDGWTAIVPWGFVLSCATVLLMLVSAVIGGRSGPPR